MNLFIFNSKKIPKAFLSALLVVALVHAIELFVLPIDAFTFRCIEAVKAKNSFATFPGPFYPNKEIIKVVQGGLGHHTKYAVEKKVKWITDKYGYRKRNENVDRYEIVVIGDSNIAGSSLTQEEMYSEQLEKKLGLGVYPLAIANINTFLNSSRFNNNSPEIVILESIERNIPRLPEIRIKKNIAKRAGIKNATKAFLKKNQRLAVLCDRISKRCMYNYVTKTLSRTGQRLHVKIRSLFEQAPKKVEAQEQTKMLCLPEWHYSETRNISQETLDIIVQRIKTYKKVLNEKGIRFIFFPLPDKKTIYWKELSFEEKPIFLERLIPKLKAEEIEVLDVEGNFKKVSEENNILVYHTDDSHWNAEGVKVAVNLTEKLLQK